MPVMTSHYVPNYTHYPYFQEQRQTSYFNTKSILVEEAEKLYNLIAKDLLNEIISGYHVNGSSPYLPQIPASDKDFPPN
jgi:hypothetical protein